MAAVRLPLEGERRRGIRRTGPSGRYRRGLTRGGCGRGRHSTTRLGGGGGGQGGCQGVGGSRGGLRGAGSGEDSKVECLRSRPAGSRCPIRGREGRGGLRPAFFIIYSTLRKHIVKMPGKIRYLYPCALCGAPLVPIGRARRGGTTHHDDWPTRRLHKQCYKLQCATERAQGTKDHDRARSEVQVFAAKGGSQRRIFLTCELSAPPLRFSFAIRFASRSL